MNMLHRRNNIAGKQIRTGESLKLGVGACTCAIVSPSYLPDIGSRQVEVRGFSSTRPSLITSNSDTRLSREEGTFLLRSNNSYGVDTNGNLANHLLLPRPGDLLSMQWKKRKAKAKAKQKQSKSKAKQSKERHLRYRIWRLLAWDKPVS